MHTCTSWPGSRLVSLVSTIARLLDTTSLFLAWSTSRNLRGTTLPTWSSVSPAHTNAAPCQHDLVLCARM